MNESDDFQPGFQTRDMTLGAEAYDDAVLDSASSEEREATEYSELFTRPDRIESYENICLLYGLNPSTQEPWTEEEIAEHIQEVGYDPRDIAEQLRREEKFEATFRHYMYGEEPEGGQNG